ncbi:hypothetical protein P280DRAFT_480891 [Massarina eburnea CBS 473.64]|uniref:Uncharacterized protein n=1 Tax=Massarina eburnea CBS 473.64 TaxID=1395130 RepID=A0A6A6RWA7_9PLEO|nr:hypothetical protein P280DRAFT_480891 [Massarina eburnea CBS 473.64]
MTFTIPTLDRAAITAPQPIATSTDSGLPTVGPIPLAAFICLILFGPFAIGFICWVTYLFTWKRFMNSRQRQKDLQAKEAEGGKRQDIEMQVRQLVGDKSRVFATRDIGVAV